MSALSRRVASSRATVRSTPIVSPASTYGRTAAYRRLASQLADGRTSSLYSQSSLAPSSAAVTVLRSQFLPHTISRDFSSAPISYAKVGRPKQNDFISQAQQKKSGGISFRDVGKASRAQEQKPEDINDPPRPEPEATESAKASPEESSKAEEAYQKAQGESQESTQGEEGPKEEEGEKKKTPPPPPPKHGDKTPWQVFTETLQQEFKASKEWNEGTKQLQGSVHDFTQNPNVQRARSAYNKATEAAGSTTSAALKSTAGAIGSGAAWTWDTSVVKGLRKGAGAVGSGVEKVTRPLRETEAYKDVKNVIDDGSSSRYGGWTEKEERRRRRAEQEAREIAEGKRPRRSEPMEEDPKSVSKWRLNQSSEGRANRTPAPVQTSLYTKTPHGRNPGATSATPRS